MKWKILATILLSWLMSMGCAATFSNIVTIMPNASLQWAQVKGLPNGVQFITLYGDSTKKTSFILWVKLPAGFVMPAHSHTIDENNTIIAGKYYMGIGGELAANSPIILPTGSFIHIPQNILHYGSTKEETIIQVSGVGPWESVFPKKKAF